jgi:8-oxo-dGTP pyrophosphatase MutT (NUDIX family)
MAVDPDDLTPEEISLLLSRLQEVGEPCADNTNFPTGFLTGPPRPAAVLIPFLKKEDRWHILYTRRTSSLSEHSGQVAFPGGRADRTDSSPEGTALREAFEEIRLDPDDVRLLGRLNRLLTITNYCVTPVVGMMPWPYPIGLALDEVSRVFSIPLYWLADPRNREVRYREMPAPYRSIPVIYFKIFEEELLWGVSAQITLNLLVALGLDN